MNFLFGGFYRCLDAGESLTNWINPQGFYVKFVRDSPAFTHRKPHIPPPPPKKKLSILKAFFLFLQHSSLVYSLYTLGEMPALKKIVSSKQPSVFQNQLPTALACVSVFILFNLCYCLKHREYFKNSQELNKILSSAPPFLERYQLTFEMTLT